MRRIFYKTLAMLLIIVALFASSISAMQSKWMNSNVAGSVKTKTTAKEDFHIFTNYDWLSENKIKEGEMSATSFSDRNEQVRNEIIKLLKGEPQKSTEGRAAQTAFNVYTDMKTRNENGMKPVLPYLEKIKAIKTMDDLTAYLMSDVIYKDSLFISYVMGDIKDGTKNVVYISAMPFSLNDADEYEKMTSVGERNKNIRTKILTQLFARLGYSTKESKALIDAAYSLEKRVAATALGSSEQKQLDFSEKTYNPLTLAQLDKMSPNFPIKQLLSVYTDLGADKFIVDSVGTIEKMNELYVPENLNDFKALLLCNMLISSYDDLDQKCLDISDAVNSEFYDSTVISNVEENAYDACSQMLDMAIGKMYADNLVAAETKADVTRIIKDTVAIFKQRLSNATWMSKATRAKAIEKLEAIVIKAAYPDDWSLYDFKGLSVKSVKEGGNALDNSFALLRYNLNKEIRLINQKPNKNQWFMPPQTVNAGYDPSENSIVIPAGILGGALYTPGGTDAENLGSIGMVIAHEISHAFDSRGSQFDKDGNLNEWWTENDKKEFAKRTKKVEEYHNKFEVLPGKYVDGLLTIGETVADLGGVSAMLEIAKGKDNFDYKTFFTRIASIWKMQNTSAIEEERLQDVHAPGYLRTNAIVQQFEEFHKTFNVKSGDNMYLEPSKRLSVW